MSSSKWMTQNKNGHSITLLILSTFDSWLRLSQTGQSFSNNAISQSCFFFKKKTFPTTLIYFLALLTLSNRHTKPGGWAEFKDWDLHIISTDNSLPQESYIYQYHKLLCDSLEQIKRPTAPGPELKKWAEQVGYVNVTERVQAMPLGTWPKEKLQVYS